MPDPVQTPDAPPERASFGDLATQIAGTREQLLDARRNEERVLEKQATTQVPQIERAKTQLGAISAEGTARTTTLEAAKPEITPPPSRKLTEFLSPVQGESPEASVLKMIQGLGLLAGSIGGLARGDARGALAGLKGALAGWSEGDAARADRAFKDWQAKTDAALAKWRVEAESYDRWFNNQNLSVEMMLKGFELDAIGHGNEKAVAAARSGRFEEALKWLQDTRVHEDQVAIRLAQLGAAHAEKESQRNFQAEQRQRDREYKEGLLRDTLAAYNEPGVLRSLGQQWFLDPNGRMPVGAPRGRVGELLRPKIVAEGIAWAREQGIDPAAAPAVRAEMGSARATLTKLRGVNAIQMAAIRRLDGHLDALLRLSKEVPRTEMPAINGAILQGQRDFKGSPAAAAYVFQAFEVSMELARVVVGTAQGDEKTREESRKQIAPALAEGQLERVVGQLRQNAHRNLETNKASEQAQLDIINAISGVKPAPETGVPEGLPDPAANKDKIARDTQTGKRYRSNGTAWEPLP